MNTTVCKLPKLDGTSFFITHTVWDDKEIKINIFDSDSVWAGQFTDEDALKVIETLGLSSEEYWTETRLALSTNHGADRFQYIVTDNQFKWVKLIAKDTIEKLEYGSIALQTGVLSLITEKMIDFLIYTNISLAAQVKHINEEKSAVESDKQQLVKTLHRHRTEKQAMEESLYANFLDILNSKKSKLAALQDCESREEVKPSSPKAGSSRSRSRSPKAGSSRGRASSPKVGTSRAKPSTWRKTLRPKPNKRAKRIKQDEEMDSPIDEEFPFQQTREALTTRKTRASTKKPIPIEEPAPEDPDEYDADTEIDEPLENPPDVCEEAHRTSDQLESNVKEKSLTEECPAKLSGVDDKIRLEAGGLEQPAEMSLSKLREFNTQKLLDDLGI